MLLKKGVYPYKYIDDWEKFNEITLPEKELLTGVFENFRKMSLKIYQLYPTRFF